MRDSYPSDISREQFEPLQATFEQSKQQTKPRVVDLYDVLCAILYVLKSGCQLMVSSACWSRRKKCGWRGPYQPRSEREDNLRDR